MKASPQGLREQRQLAQLWHSGKKVCVCVGRGDPLLNLVVVKNKEAALLLLIGFTAFEFLHSAVQTRTDGRIVKGSRY